MGTFILLYTFFVYFARKPIFTKVTLTVGLSKFKQRKFIMAGFNIDMYFVEQTRDEAQSVVLEVRAKGVP
jgi:hypothetical protein